jgi:hypothetical protein
MMWSSLESMRVDVYAPSRLGFVDEYEVSSVSIKDTPRKP